MLQEVFGYCEADNYESASYEAGIYSAAAMMGKSIVLVEIYA